MGELVSCVLQRGEFHAEFNVNNTVKYARAVTEPGTILNVDELVETHFFEGNESPRECSQSAETTEGPHESAEGVVATKAPTKGGKGSKKVLKPLMKKKKKKKRGGKGAKGQVTPSPKRQTPKKKKVVKSKA